jgi:CheY-like chemotaxis protein
LVIDDEEPSRYLLVEILREMNCSAMEAISGVEGLRIARDDRPQVILLDLTMPDMSGFDVLAELKRDPTTSGIPVIIATGKVLDDVERRELASGAVAILAKGSSSRGDVVTALRHALLNAGLRPATALEPILMQR